MTCRPDRWLLGTPALALLGAVAFATVVPRLEARLRQDVEASLAAAEPVTQLDAFGVRVRSAGRDIVLVADAPPPPDLEERVTRLAVGRPGVRRAAWRIDPPERVVPFRIEIERQDDELTLSGSVPPGRERAAILARARSVAGIERVRDGLRAGLGAPEGFAAAVDTLLTVTAALPRNRAALTDGTLSVSGEAPDTASYLAARAALARLPPGYAAPEPDILPPLTDRFAWSASRDGSGLVLSGNVPSERARAALLEMAARDGPARIADGMTTMRGLDPAIDFGALTGWAVPLLLRLDGGTVELSGQDLRVVGELAARDLLAATQAAAGQAPPGTRVTQVAIRTVPARPYRFAARRTGPRVRLSGYVPDEAARAVLRDVGARRFPLDALDDALHLADGAPPLLLEAVQSSLATLSLLAAGEVALVDREVRLTGTTPYPELAERLRRELPGALPPGWSAAIRIAAPLDERLLDADLCGDLLGDAVRRQALAFEPGRAELTPASLKALGPVVDVLRRCGPKPVRVVLESRGEDAARRDLSRRRAEALREALAGAGASAPLSAGERAIPADDAGAAERIRFEVNR